MLRIRPLHRWVRAQPTRALWRHPPRSVVAPPGAGVGELAEDVLGLEAEVDVAGTGPGVDGLAEGFVAALLEHGARAVGDDVRAGGDALVEEAGEVGGDAPAQGAAVVAETEHLA